MFLHTLQKSSNIFIICIYAHAHSGFSVLSPYPGILIRLQSTPFILYLFSILFCALYLYIAAQILTQHGLVPIANTIASKLTWIYLRINYQKPYVGSRSISNLIIYGHTVPFTKQNPYFIDITFLHCLFLNTFIPFSLPSFIAKLQTSELPSHTSRPSPLS
jgi:hypothetical protein